ncbi:MAG: hypothetical protein IPQ05_25210 [Leptospiraceae bacterium]|nr:hypothetical protein [Leptospiraceae bacterium]
MIKFKFCILILFLHCHTYRYYFHNPKPLVENNTNLANAQQKKVGLVGFYKYIYFPDDFIYQEAELDFIRMFYKNNPKVFTADLVRENTSFDSTYEVRFSEESQKKSIRIGKDYKDFKESGIDETVSEAQIREFVLKFLTNTNRSAQTEIANLIKIKNKEVKFIKRDIDYYVVGIYNPSISESTYLGLFARTITSFLSVPTFLTIPFFDRESMTKNSIYDNKLNLKKEFIYEDSYWSMNAWWVNNLHNKNKMIHTDLRSTILTTYPAQFQRQRKTMPCFQRLGDFSKCANLFSFHFF